MLHFLLRWIAVLLLSVVAFLLLFSLMRIVRGGAAAVPSLSVSLSAPVAAVAGTPVASLSSVRGRPSLSVLFINRVLAAYGSPARGLGQAMYADSVRYGIDDVFALAFFWHESVFGRFGVAAVTHSVGNIVCTSGYPSCVGRFRSYASWQAGCLDWFRLIATVYLPHGLTTVAAIVPVYAPASDQNNVSAYCAAVLAAVKVWRSGRLEVS